jgi:hypothetical protein
MADMHRRSSRLAVRHKVWLDAGRRFALGDGGVVLLRAIDANGSIRAAAQRAGRSYRHTRAYLDNVCGPWAWRTWPDCLFTMQHSEGSFASEPCASDESL